jgi:hypothetical protein
MIQQDIVNIIRHLLLPLQHSVWYAINPTNDFHPTLHYATNLQEYDYTTMLLVADIFYFRDNEICVCQTKLEQLQQDLQGNMTIYISRCQIRVKYHGPRDARKEYKRRLRECLR